MGDIYFLSLSYQIRVSLLVLLSPLPSRVSLYFHGYPILHPRFLIFSFYFPLSFPIIFIFEPTDHGYIFRKLVDIKSCPREERHYLIYDIISYKMLYFIIKCALKYLRTSSFVIDFLFMSCHIYFVHHRYLHFAVFFPFCFFIFTLRDYPSMLRYSPPSYVDYDSVSFDHDEKALTEVYARILLNR